MADRNTVILGGTGMVGANMAQLLDRDAHPIDQVVVTFFEKPHSYTAEDVVEISCHGSRVVLRACVEAACRAGARLAEPGEFTLRAYLNGRMDLPQAEAHGPVVGGADGQGGFRCPGRT